MCGGRSGGDTVGGKESTIGLIDLIDLPKKLEAPIGLDLKIKGNGSIVLF